MTWRARHFVPDPPDGGSACEEDVHDTCNEVEYI
jgi:hypothetical protein